MKNWFLSAGLLTAASLQAALPPLYQSTHEIEAILEHPQLNQYLPSGEPVVGIFAVEGGYIVQSVQHRVIARVHYLPSNGKVGPASFEIELSSPPQIPEVQPEIPMAPVEPSGSRY